MRKGHFIIFVLYLFLAIYFLNGAIGFVSLPDFLFKIDKWMLFSGGILLFIAGLNFLKYKRHYF